MLITEQEAKQKWCPQALVRNYDSAVNRGRVGDINRDLEEIVEKHNRCRASGCMAWRWAEEKNAEAVAEFEATCPTGASMGCEVTGPSPVGYCGIVGRPE